VAAVPTVQADRVAAGPAARKAPAAATRRRACSGRISDPARQSRTASIVLLGPA
jgi:hypothetical protein